MQPKRKRPKLKRPLKSGTIVIVPKLKWEGIAAGGKNGSSHYSPLRGTTLGKISGYLPPQQKGPNFGGKQRVYRVQLLAPSYKGRNQHYEEKDLIVVQDKMKDLLFLKYGVQDAD